MKQLFSFAALFVFGLTGNLIAQEYQSNWSSSINVPSVGDHINVYPYSDNHNYMYFNADLELASTYGGHDCCNAIPLVADHEDQDGYVVYFSGWSNAVIDIITPTFADNGGISDLGLTQLVNKFRDKWNEIRGELGSTSGYSTINDKATLLAFDDIILDLEVDYTNKDYSIAKKDTIPVFTQYYALDENNSQIVFEGVADNKFTNGNAYLSSDGTRHIVVYKRNANVNGEQYLVLNMAFSIKTDSGWKSSFEKAYTQRNYAYYHWEFQDDLNSMKWIDRDGVSVFQLDWYWNALAAQEEFYTNDEENEADFHFTKMGLPLTDANWDNENDPTVFALAQQTNLSIQFGLHLETAERSQIVAETYSGDGNYQFIANSDMSIDIFELQENGDYSLIKQVWGHPDARWWGDGDKKSWSVISLSANYDGTKLWSKSRAIWDDHYTSSREISGTMTQITLDYSRPYLTHLSQNEENLLEFNVSFSEIVKSRTFYSDVSYNDGTPSPKDFQIILDGQAVDESSASIRSVRSINQDPNCPSCYNPSDTFVISLRTPNGAISGDLSFAMSESSYVFDNYDNSIEKDSTTNSVSITDFDGLGYILNSETTEELIANLNYAGSSDTLLLQKGTYEIENRLDLSEKALTLTSTYDSDVDNQDAILETIIAYTGSEDCVTFLSAYPGDGELTIINGLTFQGKVTSCETRNNIGGNNGHVMFINNIVKGFNYGLQVWGNQAKEEGVNLQHIIENNLFTENILGLTLENGEFLVTDNLIWRNGADETSPSTPCRQGGLKIEDDDSFVLYNMILENTMYNGCDDRSPGVQFEWSPYTIFMNNVVYGNSGSKPNNIAQREFGMPTVDHNVIGNFGSGRNKVLNPGPNNFDEDPQIFISEEPLPKEEGYVVMQHMGLYVMVNENSVLFGNGFEVEATEGMIGHRLPQPFGSAPDILAFEHSNGMMANPMVSVDLNYPIDAASDIGVNPAFGWEPIKYATQYEIEISSSSEFTNSLKVVIQGLELANLENNLEAIDGAYYWRVRGINPTKVGDWSEIRSFTTGGSVVQPLGPTKLLEPINDQTDVNTLASFNWEAVEEASGYSLQIATDDNFSAIIRDLTTATNSLSLSEALDENNDYFWRVKALNENPARNSDWTNTFRFVTMSSVSNESLAGIPMNYDLYQNYPNPFNPNTQIRYALPEASIVRVEVYNSLGQQVAVLVDGHMNAGYHQLSFNATGLSSGVYLYKITTPNYSMTKKMLLMK